MQDRIDAGEYVRPCDGETLSGDTALVQWGDDGVLVGIVVPDRDPSFTGCASCHVRFGS
jgi:hypothetical protein